jgi:hypothetical protein
MARSPTDILTGSPATATPGCAGTLTHLLRFLRYGPNFMFNLATVFIAATLATSEGEPFLSFIRIYAKYGRT